MANYGQFSGVAINWLTFGSSNHYLDPTHLVTESYFLRSPMNTTYNQLVKSIINPRHFIEWPNVHLPIMEGHIVREDQTICNHFNMPIILHNHISIFHYRGKSKEYHIFTKIKRHIDLDQLKTPIINAHRKGGDSFFEIYYSNVLLWEISNYLACNCVEDLTMFKLIPQLKKRLKLETPTAMTPNILDYLVIDYPNYIKKFPVIQTYINNNKNYFNHSLLPLLFHYWFIFDEKKDNIVSLKPARELIKNINLDHYKTPIFRDFVNAEYNTLFGIDGISPEIQITDNIIYKYYLDTLIMLPNNFDIAHYRSHHPQLSQLNEFEMIKHWLTQITYQESLITKPLSRCKTRLLIMDCLFPFIYGHWRIVEINYLLTHPDFDVDILINPYAHTANTSVNENMIISFQRYYKLYPHLDNYNILIFNPEFNVLNQFNKSIDGTQFNGQIDAQFLLTKKSMYDFRKYDVAYSIFLQVRNSNVQLIKQKWWPSVCKIYPGGGYFYDDRLTAPYLIEMNKYNETVIVTQEFIAKSVGRYVTNMKKIYGVPIVTSDMPYIEKSSLNKNKLDICFSSLGFHPKKGFNNYLALAQHFLDQHKNLDITFHVIGISSASTQAKLLTNTIYHGIKTPNDLFAFYADTIDIIVSPIVALTESGDPDGFPLGSEAMVQGCIPILCDPHNANQQYGFNDTESLIMPIFDLNKTETFIISLYNDTHKRHAMSLSIANKSRYLLGPEKQLYPVVDILLNAVVKYRTENVIKQVPEAFMGGCPIDEAILIGH